MSLNRKSQWMVDNVYQGFTRLNPGSVITKYDEGSNTQCIKWVKNGSVYRIYKFYANWDGAITSLTIHGVNVMGEYNAMSRSKVAFGLPVRSLDTKQGADGLYVEVLLGSY